MSGAGEGRHIRSNLGDEAFGGALGDAGDLIKALEAFLKRAEPLLDLQTHLINSLVEEVDVFQLLCEEEAVAGQLAQFPLGPRRNETASDQSLAKQVGDPFTVSYIGLASGSKCSTGSRHYLKPTFNCPARASLEIALSPSYFHALRWPADHRQVLRENVRFCSVEPEIGGKHPLSDGYSEHFGSSAASRPIGQRRV